MKAQTGARGFPYPELHCRTQAGYSRVEIAGSWAKRSVAVFGWGWEGDPLGDVIVALDPWMPAWWFREE